MTSLDLVPVINVVGSYCVKYDKLYELIQYSFKGSQATEIDLYIDLYSIYHTIMSRSGRTDMSDYTALTNGVINMCSHYRSFFKKLGVNTTIFLIASYNVPEISRKICPEYNRTMIEKLAEPVSSEMVNINNQLISLITKYLYHIYYVPTSFEASIAIDHLIRVREVNYPKIIISKDTYPLGLVYRYPDLVCIHPKKLYGEDASTITSTMRSGNALYDFWRILYREYRKCGPETSTIVVSPSNFDILQALSSFVERDLRPILAVKEAVGLISNTIGSLDTKVNLDLVLANNPEKYNSLNISEVQARYNTLNIDFQYNLYLQSKEPSLINLEDLYDPESLSKINEKYFRDNLIDFQRL